MSNDFQRHIEKIGEGWLTLNGRGGAAARHAAPELHYLVLSGAAQGAALWLVCEILGYFSPNPYGGALASGFVCLGLIFWASRGHILDAFTWFGELLAASRDESSAASRHAPALALNLALLLLLAGISLLAYQGQAWWLIIAGACGGATHASCRSLDPAMTRRITRSVEPAHLWLSAALCSAVVVVFAHQALVPACVALILVFVLQGWLFPRIPALLEQANADCARAAGIAAELIVVVLGLILMGLPDRGESLESRVRSAQVANARQERADLEAAQRRTEELRRELEEQQRRIAAQLEELKKAKN
ncbi:MAG: hypothetical protein RL095_2597 [Verrucomicrobiota bacterium]